MNNIVTVYGTDIDLSNPSDCKVISYIIEEGTNSETLYSIVRDAMVFAGHIENIPLKETALVGIDNGMFSLQGKLNNDDIIILSIPIKNAKLMVCSFMMGTFNTNDMKVSDVTRESLTSRLSKCVNDEFQSYLNHLMRFKQHKNNNVFF